MLELGSLVRRDHDELHDALRLLGDGRDPTLLVRVQRGFEAHTEAQTVILGALLEHVRPPPSVYFLVAQVVAAHLAQETALAHLVAQPAGSPAFHERAQHLRRLCTHHADHEAACVLPALAEHVPRDDYRALAASYARERERVFAHLRAA